MLEDKSARFTSTCGELDAWFQEASAMPLRLLLAATSDADRETSIEWHLGRRATEFAGREHTHARENFIPIVILLSLLQEHIRSKLNVKHWRSAIESLKRYEDDLGRLQEHSALAGLWQVTAAQLFFNECVQQLEYAGVVFGRRSHLSEDNKKTALSNATAAGFGYLVALVYESYESTGGEQQDIRRGSFLWIGQKVADAKSCLPLV